MGYTGSDERYKLWLEMYHPDEEENVSLNSSVIHTPVRVSRPASSIALAKPTSSLERLFCKPTPPSMLPTLKPIGSSRVITSAESLKQLLEKERKKEEAQKKKEERLRRARERKEALSKLIIKLYG